MSRGVWNCWLAFFCLQLLNSTAMAEAAPLLVGGIENVQIEPGGLVLRAKLDTGADSSSLGVEDLQYFQKGTELWVRFRMRTRGGEQQMLEFKTIRTAKIKREGGRLEKRPVIRLGICMGDFYMLVDANLTDRSEYAYPMLIGRDYIVGHLIIDASKSYLASPQCPILAKKKKTKNPYEKKH